MNEDTDQLVAQYTWRKILFYLIFWVIIIYGFAYFLHNIRVEGLWDKLVSYWIYPRIFFDSFRMGFGPVDAIIFLVVVIPSSYFVLERKRISIFTWMLLAFIALTSFGYTPCVGAQPPSGKYLSVGYLDSQLNMPLAKDLQANPPVPSLVLPSAHLDCNRHSYWFFLRIDLLILWIIAFFLQGKIGILDEQVDKRDDGEIMSMDVTEETASAPPPEEPV